MTEPRIRTGGCQCGAVRFRTTAEPRHVSACHCRMCQRALGAPFGIYAVFASEAVEWTHGTPKVFASSNVAGRGFCADCGTPLTFQAADGGSIDILSAVFDDPADLGPGRVIGIESKLPWIDHLPALPARTTDENRGPRASPILSRQAPSRD